MRLRAEHGKNYQDISVGVQPAMMSDASLFAFEIKLELRYVCTFDMFITAILSLGLADGCPKQESVQQATLEAGRREASRTYRFTGTTTKSVQASIH